KVLASLLVLLVLPVIPYRLLCKHLVWFGLTPHTRPYQTIPITASGATPQNTTSKERAKKLSRTRFDFNSHHRLTPPKVSGKAVGKQPATLVTSNEQPDSVAGPSSPRASQEPTPQADQLQSTPGKHTESSPSEMKTPPKDEPIPRSDEDLYKPRYASMSQRPKLKPRSRKRPGSRSSSPPTIERLRIADTSEVTLQSPNLIPVA
ncbi:hypothetical protein HZ326_11505, partial [Fusarium oxysporum f. sp. albedinis]